MSSGGVAYLRGGQETPGQTEGAGKGSGETKLSVHMLAGKVIRCGELVSLREKLGEMEPCNWRSVGGEPRVSQLTL